MKESKPGRSFRDCSPILGATLLGGRARIERALGRDLDDRFHETGTELEACSWIPRFEIVRTRVRIMATWRQAVELAMTEEEIENVDGSFAVSNRVGEPGVAGSDAAGLSREPVVLCRGTKTWRASSDGSALRRAGGSLWCAGGTRRPTATGQGAGDHAGGQGLAGVFGVRQGQGARLPARTVDDAAAGPPCARAWPVGGTPMPCQPGPGHGVQDSRPRGNQAAQGALLSGASRCRVRAENGGGPVCLSRGPGPEEERRQVEEVGQAGGDHLLRREARNTGDRDDGAGFAACEIGRAHV